MSPIIETVTLSDGTSFELVKVEGGQFMMGNDESKRRSQSEEIKVKDFWIGKFPVTQELWQTVMGDNPARFKGSLHPVERVSWDDTQLFFQKLNEMTGETYRLPSEAEWEYAARGGKYSCGFRFAGSNKLKEVGWYRNNAHGETKPVGLKMPNELGLYDMSGNVREWCEGHVVRGGSWFSSGNYCTVSYRNGFNADSRSSLRGFRLARY